MNCNCGFTLWRDFNRRIYLSLFVLVCLFVALVMVAKRGLWVCWIGCLPTILIWEL